MRLLLQDDLGPRDDRCRMPMRSKDLEPQTHLTNLRELTISLCQPAEHAALQTMQSLTRLTKLVYGAITSMTDQALVALMPLTQLRSLHLRHVFTVPWLSVEALARFAAAHEVLSLLCLGGTPPCKPHFNATMVQNAAEHGLLLDSGGLSRLAALYRNGMLADQQDADAAVAELAAESSGAGPQTLPREPLCIEARCFNRAVMSAFDRHANPIPPAQPADHGPPFDALRASARAEL